MLLSIPLSDQGYPGLGKVWEAAALFFPVPGVEWTGRETLCALPRPGSGEQVGSSLFSSVSCLQEQRGGSNSSSLSLTCIFLMPVYRHVTLFTLTVFPYLPGMK